MPQRTAIWAVSDNPSPLAEARLPSEKVLEDMIVAALIPLNNREIFLPSPKEGRIGHQRDTRPAMHNQKDWVPSVLAPNLDELLNAADFDEH